MANNNTLHNIGIRRTFTGLGARNFETDGTVQYKSAKNGLYFNGSHYNIGTNIPFDGGGSPHITYSVDSIALLQFYWNNNFIAPVA